VFAEIDWDARLDPHNHAPHFPFSFTIITDTFPVFIEAPQDPFLNDLFYGGKYGRHCVKVGIGGIAHLNLMMFLNQVPANTKMFLCSDIS